MYLYLLTVFLNGISCVHTGGSWVVVHHNHSHLRAKTSRAQVAFTHMKNKLENALETNSNLQISNLARVQTWSCAGQGDSSNSWSTSSSSSSSSVKFGMHRMKKSQNQKKRNVSTWNKCCHCGKIMRQNQSPKKIIVYARREKDLWRAIVVEQECDDIRMWNESCQIPSRLNGDHQVLSAS